MNPDTANPAHAVSGPPETTSNLEGGIALGLKEIREVTESFLVWKLEDGQKRRRCSKLRERSTHTPHMRR